MWNIDGKNFPFWLISDVTKHITGFLTYGTETTVYEGAFFNKMINDNGLKGKYNLVDIEFPEFITVVEDGLPLNVAEEFAEIKEKNRSFSNGIQVPYLTTPIKTVGSVWVERDPAMIERFNIASDFADNPITQEEWEEVQALIQDINNYDFVFDNLEKSIFFRRNEQGKLVIGVLKFKGTILLSDNSLNLYSIGNYLEEAGLKVGRSGHVIKPQINSEIDPSVLANVTRAEMVVTERGKNILVHAVWKLYDKFGKIVGYLKYGTEEEIANMKKLHKIIIQNNLLEKYKDIRIKYARILAEDTDGLPENILMSIQKDYEKNKQFVRDPHNRAKKMFIVAPVEDRGFCWGNMGSDIESVRTALARLNNIPITAQEWEMVFNFFTDLHIQGFDYEDIYNNLSAGRGRDNVFEIAMIDFEPEGYSNSLAEIRDLGNTFTKFGIKKTSSRIDNWHPDDEET